jgi:hypothetical protein
MSRRSARIGKSFRIAGEPMAQTEHILTDADIGAVLDPPNGFLQSVQMTQPPSRYDSPTLSADRSVWACGVFSIRGEGNFADMINIDAGNAFKRFTNLGFAYKGGLVIRSIPHGSIWEIVTSDTPVIARKKSPLDEALTRAARAKEAA